MNQWITVADALKKYHITKPTLYKYIGLGKVHTELVRNKLFIDRSWLNEYINNRKKYWWKPVDNYMKWLFVEPEKTWDSEWNRAKWTDWGVEKTETIPDENNSQNRLATVTVWWLWKMIEDLQWLIQSKDLLLEKKNKTITRLSSIMWLLIWLFISLIGLFIYLIYFNGWVL